MALAKFIKAGHKLLLFHFGFIDEFSKFEDGHEAFEFFESHFEEFVAFVPGLGLVEDAFVSNSIGNNNDTASLAMFADDSECGDDGGAECGLALSVVGDGLEIEGFEIEISDFVGVAFSIFLSSFEESVEWIEVDNVPLETWDGGFVLFIWVYDQHFLAFLCITIKHDVGIEKHESNGFVLNLCGFGLCIVVFAKVVDFLRWGWIGSSLFARIYFPDQVLSQSHQQLVLFQMVGILEFRILRNLGIWKLLF